MRSCMAVSCKAKLNLNVNTETGKETLVDPLYKDVDQEH